MSANVSIDSGRDFLAIEYRQLAEDLSRSYALIGVNAPAGSDPAMPAFARLSQKDKLAAIEAIRIFGNVVRDAKPGFGLENKTKANVWRLLKYHGLNCNPDLLDRLHDDVIVDCYDRDEKLIATNERFHELTSYDIEEIFGMHWGDFFTRDLGVLDKIKGGFGMALAQGLKRTMDVNVGPYVIREFRSSERRAFEITTLSFSPLFKDGKNAGVCIIHRAERI